MSQGSLSHPQFGKVVKGAVAGVALAGAVAGGASMAMHGGNTSVAHHATSTSAPAAKHAAPAATMPAGMPSQANVDFNNMKSTLAVDLNTENSAPTVANHVKFENDAQKIGGMIDTAAKAHDSSIGSGASQKAWKQVATDLTPGPTYGSSATDYKDWNAALSADTSSSP